MKNNNDFTELAEQVSLLRQEVQSLTTQLGNNTKTIVDDDIIDIKRVMEITGYSDNTIYAYKKTKGLPYIKNGNAKLLFNKKEVLNWLVNRPEINN